MARIAGSTTIAIAWPTPKVDELASAPTTSGVTTPAPRWPTSMNANPDPGGPGRAGGAVVQLREEHRRPEAADQEPDDRHRHARDQHREDRADRHHRRGDPDQSNRADTHLDPVAAEASDRHAPREREEGEARPRQEPPPDRRRAGTTTSRRS